MEEGKTFILRSIDRIEITSVDFPDTLWGHAASLGQMNVMEQVLPAMFGSSISRANRIWNFRVSHSPC